MAAKLVDFRTIIFSLAETLIRLIHDFVEHSIPRFCVHVPGEMAYSTDALLLKWVGMLVYLFPTALLNSGECRLYILISLIWPSHLWFQELLLLMDLPRSLPDWPHILSKLNEKEIYPCPKIFRLYACFLQNDPSERKVFLHWFPLPSQQYKPYAHKVSSVTHRRGIDPFRPSFPKLADFE